MCGRCYHWRSINESRPLCMLRYENSRTSRVAFRKNRHARRRQTDVTRQFANDGDVSENLASTERLSGKGELTRTTAKLLTVEGGVDDSGVSNDTWRGQGPCPRFG